LYVVTAQRQPGTVVKKRAKKAIGTADRGGVQSVTVAAKILKSLAASGSMPLKDIAAATHMPRAKVHRYLSSLRKSGLVEQSAETSHYRIGATAIAIGLTGLRRINPIAEVCAALPALRDRIAQTVTAAIWSEIGPIIVAMQEADHWLTMNVRIGTALPLTTTAIGRTFLAHLPPPVTAPLVEAELNRMGAASDPGLDELLAEIRTRKLARAPSAMLPGVDAIAAPVFDYRDTLVAVICVVARSEANITGWDGTAVRALTETAQELSARLGYVASADSGASTASSGETTLIRSSPRKRGPRASQ
jgi:DNA-binding IclR family transcriptional regulator